MVQTRLMRSGDDQTLSLAGRGDDLDRVEARPHLFLALRAARPRLPAARYGLGELDAVELTRGRTDRVDAPTAPRRLLRVAVCDGWMSTNHAVIERDGERWRLTDHRSKNGTFVNGVRQREAMLVDGDVVELGQTFFVYRAALATPADAPARLDAGEVRGPPGLATLLPELGLRFAELARIAASKSSLVIAGPTGSGKELVARAVHELSGRRGPFVAVNCAALPDALVESELFGYVRGAFSGADRDRDGLITASGGGTLFLDEIGDLPRPAQAKLLRALQEQEVRPVGAIEPVRVDLRVVAATHRDLAQLAEDDEFREDLLARLGDTFELPPLAERREDLGLIVGAILARLEDPRARDVGLSSEAARALLRHAWPRNVRELHKLLERAIALADGRDIELAHLPDELRSPGAARPRRPAVVTPLSDRDRERRDQIVALLRANGGNITAVARAMGKVRSQVQRWIKRYAIDPDAP
jgi:transcriptional regulator of acetoin/glycerol metabolism